MWGSNVCLYHAVGIGLYHGWQTYDQMGKHVCLYGVNNITLGLIGKLIITLIFTVHLLNFTIFNFIIFTDREHSLYLICIKYEICINL